jgi:hypothetical protein
VQTNCQIILATTPYVSSIEYYSIRIRQFIFINTGKTFPLPFLADSINEGTIAEFVKKEGQWVELD